MFKKFFAIILFFSLIFSFFQVEPASAAPKIDLKAEIGIANKVKYNTATPLKLTITNNGSDFSGDVVIDIPQSYYSGSAQVYSLDIAEGETKVVEVYLNGVTENYSYNSTGQQRGDYFYFYEGGIEEGKLIEHTGTSFVNPQFLDQYSTFIYTLTENSDRLSAIERLNQFSTYYVEVFHLNQRKIELPTDVKGLSLANIIVVDEESLTDLSEEQQDALYNWVEQGGTMLIGASDQVDASVGIFEDYLPLSLSTEKVGVSKENLQAITTDGIFTNDIEVYKAQEREGSTRLLSDGETILASKQIVGSGSVIQTAFSLGDQPLAAMDGYSKLLTKVLSLSGNVQQSQGNYYYDNFDDYLANEVSSVNELFPSFEISSTGLIVVIVIYILIIGPVLYFILKRKDKREHAWWIIPIISVIISLGMFIFGARDRIFHSQIQQSALYKVEGNDLSGYYVEALLTNKGGEFKFNLDKETTAVASNARSMYTSDPAMEKLHEKSYVKAHGDGATLNLRDLKYWSVQSVMGKSRVKDVGNLDVKLTIFDGKIEGSIKNDFPFKLNDVSIWAGSKTVVLGDIEAGSTLKVSKDHKGSVLLKPNLSSYSYNYSYGFGYGNLKGKEDLIPARVEKLKYGVGTLFENENKPVIIGWTDQALVGIKLDGNGEVSPVAYIAQSFEPEVELSGEFTLDSDSLITNIEPITTTAYAQNIDGLSNRWYLEAGEYEYIVSVAEGIKNKGNWSEIMISNKNTNRLDLQIFNSKTGKYEKIKEASITITKNLEQYISKDGQLKVLIKANEVTNNAGPVEVTLPEVKIKGVSK